MTNQNVLKFDDLQELTGYERAGDVERVLQKSGIRYFHGRKGCWTTLALVNAAGGIVGDKQMDNPEIL